MMKFYSVLLTFLFTFASGLATFTGPKWLALLLGALGGLTAINFVCACFREEFSRAAMVIDED